MGDLQRGSAAGEGKGEEREKFEDASHKQKQQGRDGPGWQLQALWEHGQKHLA